MKRIDKKIKPLIQKGVTSIKHEGVGGFTKRTAKFIYYRQFPERKKKAYKDILFINGCSLPHPTRYRVDHQLEQLRASGISADSIFYDQLNDDMLKYYRGFVFFRCPVTDQVRSFIDRAKANNKACFFDIDDLVIDQKYTNQIQYVRNMNQEERAVYDDGVNRMRETMGLCDFVITTTETLSRELGEYKNEVFINRNVASDEMVKHSLTALKTKKNGDRIVLGYFSGSITHNEDFRLILPDLIKVMRDNERVYLKIAGILDIPKELNEFKNRIITSGFVDWRLMPKEIAGCDINLAPLVNTVFNCAKSENKWVEAALVKVVTVASNVGAFGDSIRNGVTGVLVDNNEWYEALSLLIDNKDLREGMAIAAHKDVLSNHTTIPTSNRLAEYIRSKLARNIAFVLPSTDISGGVNVALKHAEILRNRGWDVTLIDAIHKGTLKKSLKQYNYRLELPGYNVITSCKSSFDGYFESMVATLWSTVGYIKKYSNTSNRLYLVQNLETDFYLWGQGEPRLQANSTYNDTTGIKYITISLWCKKWLKTRFGKNSEYASNGIDLRLYPYRKRDFKGKIHVLVEGDSKSEYKNTDEAFKIIERLDSKKFEISYLSYRKEPKDWYRVDHFYNRISPDKVGEVYAKCDILIKTSLLESFSYPPLEMMATGGVSVVVPNDGNVEYLRDGENCLFYKQGNIEDGVSKVMQLVEDKKLRDRLISGGLKTAKDYQWEHIEEDIVRLYQ